MRSALAEISAQQAFHFPVKRRAASMGFDR